MSPDMPTIVTPLSPALAPGALWQPTIGTEAMMLPALERLPGQRRDAIQQTAAAILGRGQPHNDATGRRTGLVVGYVQSGKTLSFTTVIALARDNGCPLVIVVAGTSAPLLKQTTDRLLEDLQVNVSDGPPRWVQLNNPDRGNRQIVQKTIDDWRDASVPENEKATLLIMVMKQHQRLNNLNGLLASLDLNGVPALIIDDEADQASLNTRVNQGEESTTYQRLLELRDYLPSQTFLQYTATPQAPLLINIIDVLSPEFVEVLEPGDGYVGGLDFFSGNSQLVRVIPNDDIPAPDNELDEPPRSLLEALLVFFVGVAAGLIEGWSRTNPNRSMLVHPSRTTDRHFQYFQCIEMVVAEWRRLLALPPNDNDRLDLVQDFENTYHNLADTTDQLPEFDAILERLPRALAATQIREINVRGRTRTPQVEWRQAYPWILVGGQAMDRGFTVKELTVTYMPRGTGAGNADTLQQRARFFGYKRRYLGYCRIYLEANALAAFEAYVQHEEEMRTELQRVRDGGMSLSEWKRRFVLSQDLNPCRTSVVQHDYVRGNFADDWFFPRMMKMNQEFINANRAASNDFVGSLQFRVDTSYNSDQPAQQHELCDIVLLNRIMTDFLLRYRVEDARDTQEMLGVMLQLSKALEQNPQETGRVYRMRPTYTGAMRGLDSRGCIPSIRRLFQGPTRSGQGYSYPGDHAFRDPGRITLQLHTFDLTENEAVVRHSVPVFAMWVPRRMALDWLTQHQQT
jgi:hypothetical protein